VLSKNPALQVSILGNREGKEYVHYVYSIRLQDNLCV